MHIETATSDLFETTRAKDSAAADNSVHSITAALEKAASVVNEFVKNGLGPHLGHTLGIFENHSASGADDGLHPHLKEILSQLSGTNPDELSDKVRYMLATILLDINRADFQPEALSVPTSSPLDLLQ